MFLRIKEEFRLCLIIASLDTDLVQIGIYLFDSLVYGVTYSVKLHISPYLRRVENDQ